MSAVVKAVKKVVKTVAKAVTKVVDTVVNTVKAVIKDPLPTIAALAGQAIGIPAPVTMAAITGARGGDLGDMAKAATIAYVAPQAASKVASAIAPTISSSIANEAVAKAVTSATSKALVNGTIAEATGGDFGEAAAGTMAGSLAASGYQNYVAPSVMAKATEMGLDVDTAKNISAGLRTGVAAGTATAVSGGDFVAGFATAVADYGIEEGFEKAGESFKTSSVGTALRESPVGDAARKVSDVYDNVTDAIDNAFKKKDVTNTASLGNGVPNDVVNEVPVSPNAEPGIVADADGKAIGTINPASNDDAFNQIVAAFEEPRAPSTQFGLPTAEYKPAGFASDQPWSVGDVTITPTGKSAKDGVLPEVIVTGSSTDPEKTPSFIESGISDELKKAALTGDVETLKMASGDPESLPTTVSKGEPGQGNRLDEVVVSFGEPLTQSADLEDLKSLYKASTGAALVPSASPSLPELQQKVEEAKLEVVQASVEASVVPTPDNAQKLDDAKANLEIAEKTYENAATQAQPSEAASTLPSSPEAPTFSVEPAAPSLPDLQAAAEEAKGVAVDAAVIANVLPTPDNVQAARDAQLNAELAQAALNEATQKTDLVPGAPVESEPSTAVSTTFPGEAETTGQPTTFTPPAALPSTEDAEGALQPSTIGGMVRGDEAGVIGGLGTLSTETGTGEVGGVAGDVSGGLPSGLPGGDLQGVAGNAPGGVDTGLPGGATEGIPQLPEVEVTGEFDEDGKYVGPQFPITRPSRFPVITYNYLGEPTGRRMVRRSPLMSLLDATGTDRGALGDLGSGVTFIDQPIEFLQPSMLARGGLIRFRRT